MSLSESFFLQMLYVQQRSLWNKRRGLLRFTLLGVKKEDFMAVDIVWCKMKPAGYTCSVSA